MTPEAEAKLTEWQGVKKMLDQLKEQELLLRKTCCHLIFPDGKIGVNTEKLAAGWSVKATFKINYSFDEQALPAVLVNLQNAGVKEIEKLIKLKRSPVMKEIKKLPLEAQQDLNEALIAKPASPTLQLIEPKEEK